MTKTTNYDFVKASLGHSVRDVDIGDNFDLIDAAINARADSITALEALADGKIIVGDGDGAAADVAMSGDITINNTGVTAIGTGKAVIANLEAALLKGIVTLDMSFESCLVTVTKLYFPFKVTINKIRSIVMKEIAGTDDGTITGANSVGSSSGVVTVAASSALNAEDSVDPVSNVVVDADSYYQLTTAKPTKGGTVLVTLEYTRTA